jgi:adenine-specific DNA methylase
MRLGCEVTAIDINPVAWFILKCTLEYPQRLAGRKRPLPEFVQSDRAFMESFFKAQGFKGAGLRSQLRKLGLEGEPSQQATLKDTQTGSEVDLQIEEHTLDADLAWHVRAWGWWVLREARRDLAKYYPVYADFEPLEDPDQWRQQHSE